MAKFKISRLVPVEFSSDMTMEELWQIHRASLEKESELERSLDEGRTSHKDLEVQKTSLLHLKSTIAQKIMKSCVLCERRCMKDRSGGELGYCRVGENMYVSSHFDHMGEEPEIVPSFTVYDRKSAELA